jgi:amino acid transporter
VKVSGSVESDKGVDAKLGTFGGVFTPSILTILGIILFLRLGYVVGSAGLGRALIIIGLANMISVLTTISLSAIATNLKVKGGGYYYLISRTLGVEFGGAIGTVLFLAQSMSIAFYCIGMGEALGSMLPHMPRAFPQLAALVAVAILFVFAWLGSDWSTRFQYVVMVLIAAALVSFFAGGFLKLDSAVMTKNWALPAGGPPFWIIFALFFPAVTGFTQGVSMSGDLKDPSRSLPLGTFMAVGLSIVVYFSVALIFAATMPVEALRGDYNSMRHVARIGWLIDAGVIAATVSSAMASFLGAPRILQSMAKDRIFSFLTPFGKGWGPLENPRRGVILSGIIAAVTIGLGNLNVIAPVVSMFFLISYGLLNYATYYESHAGSPSFRPTFRYFDKRLSLLGALSCLGVMLLVNFVASLLAVGILFGLYQYLQRTAGPARWADSKNAYHFRIMRDHLAAIPETAEHPRDWRPQILAFSDDSHRRRCLLRFANWIEGNSGLTAAVRILPGRGNKLYELRKEAEQELLADIAKEGVNAFAKVITAPDFRVGAEILVQSFGVGAIKPNTILLNGPEQVSTSKGRKLYGLYLSEAMRLGCNVIVLHVDEEMCDITMSKPASDQSIDLWWRDDASGRLMLLLAYLMTRSDEWNGATIRLFVQSSAKEGEKSRKIIQAFLDDIRIAAEIEIVEKTTMDTIYEYSSGSAIVFLPLILGKAGPAGPHGVYLDTIFSRLPTVALIIAAEDIELEALPEEGKGSEIATTLDVAADTEKRAVKLEKVAERITVQSKEKIEKLELLLAGDEGTKDRKEIEQTIRGLKNTLKEAERDAKEARSEADKAAHAAEKQEGTKNESE